MRLRALVALGAISIAPMAVADNGTPKDVPPAPNTVVVSRGQTIQGAVGAMAKAAGALMAVDPGLNGRVSEATSKLPLEKGLAAIAAANHAQWRKMYLAENEIPRLADGTIDARRMTSILMSVSGVQTANVGVVDSATGLMTVTSRAPETSPAMVEWAKTKKAVYVLYIPVENAPARSGANSSALPPGGLDALNAMTPEQRAEWTKAHGVYISSEMTPEQRTQALQSLPPDERARIVEKMNQTAKDVGASTMIIQHEETK